jgi:hypothetical protein
MTSRIITLVVFSEYSVTVSRISELHIAIEHLYTYVMREREIQVFYK